MPPSFWTGSQTRLKPALKPQEPTPRRQPKQARTPPPHTPWGLFKENPRPIGVRSLLDPSEPSDCTPPVTRGTIAQPRPSLGSASESTSNPSSVSARVKAPRQPQSSDHRLTADHTQRAAVGLLTPCRAMVPRGQLNPGY
ncbi:hypothetical protein SKAU_G00117190 [Synaphobranchus kaupii]|uniref:Uncharacterized protein n=1 Tax=Synaphobranchus kaupii TaxID=118154 RepID=A0A9Q1FNL0_SYNKA|nr:hypothetical protein SKAU_G00117190 [Synaphobranchus kaupii]